MREERFEECIEAMVRGDRLGLKQIYEEYVGYIYTIVYGILGNKENAEDITSEFFIKLWEKADYYKPGNGHKGYMATMARNMAVDDLRKHKREILTAAVHDGEGQEEWGAGGKAEIGAGEISGNIRLAGGASESDVEQEVIGQMTLKEVLAILKPGERKIVDMKVLGGLTFKEIAGLLSIPMGTVTWKYQNAMKKLRRCGYEEF